MKRCLMTGATAVAIGMAFAAPDARAQNSRGVPNAVQGFSQNRNQPIKIESNSLEVRDKEKIATFIDNVKLTQGDTTLETKRLIVFYDQDDPAGGARRPAGTPNASGIRRLEAKGGVVVTQKDQTAVGDEGVYDMKQNSVTLIGKVVVTQGQNVIKGERLRVDLTTGASVVEAGPGSTRVETILFPGSAPQAPAQAAPAAPRPQSNAPQTNRPNRTPASTSDRGRQTSGQPMRLN